MGSARARPSYVGLLAGKWATRVIVISNGLRDYYAARGVSASRLRTEHDAIDLDRFTNLPARQEARDTLGIPHGRFIIEYLGKFRTMGETKGVEGIIRAVGMARAVHPRAFLLLVGLNEDERADAERAVQDAGLADGDCMLVSHIPFARVPLYLRAADALVMNYPDQPHYARMMSPLKVFEYMASGVPLVTSDLPTLREVLSERTAVFVRPDDVPALAAGIERLITDPALAEAIARDAFHEVSTHTWKARTERILEGLGA